MVWVTKMDDYTVQFDSARYEEIKKAMTAFLKEVGYKLKDLHRSVFGRFELFEQVERLQGLVPGVDRDDRVHHSV